MNLDTLTMQSRDEVRKAKSCLELKTVSDVKGNKKGFLQVYQEQKEDRENAGLLLNEGRDLVTKETEKTEVLNAFFALVFTEKTGFRNPTPQ